MMIVVMMMVTTQNNRRPQESSTTATQTSPRNNSPVTSMSASASASAFASSSASITNILIDSAATISTIDKQQRLPLLGQLGKSSNSSNETVIALEQTPSKNKLNYEIETLPQQISVASSSIQTNQKEALEKKKKKKKKKDQETSKVLRDDPQMICNQDRNDDVANEIMTTETPTSTTLKQTKEDIIISESRDCDEQQQQNQRKQSIGRLRAFLLLTRAHLNPFHHNQQQQQNSSKHQVKRKQSLDSSSSSSTSAIATTAAATTTAVAPTQEMTNNLVDLNHLADDSNKLKNPTNSTQTAASNSANRNQKFVNLFNLAQRCFFFKQSSEFNLNHNHHHDANSKDKHYLNTADIPAESLAVHSKCTRSAPVTPIKWNSLVARDTGGGDDATAAHDVISKSLEQQQIPNGLGSATSAAVEAHTVATTCANNNYKQTTAISANKPSVRFVEESCRTNSDDDDTKSQVQKSSSGEKMTQAGSKCGGGKVDKWRVAYTQTTSTVAADQQQQQDRKKNDDSSVANLFKLQDVVEEGESPMNSTSFRQHGYSLIDYISNYLDTIKERRVTPLNIEPGYLKDLIEPNAPTTGESFANIMHDFENHIMCGITHWQHPHFHAYFPAGNAYPSILADMLSDALGCVGFSWAASPAYTELEIIMLDWMGKMIGLPDEFLCGLSSTSVSTSSSSSASSSSSPGAQADQQSSTKQRESKGGGVIQGSASECVLVNLLAARHWAMEKLRKKYPHTQDGILLTKLIGYCSKEAHSCVEKAAMIGFIRMRALDTDEQHSLRGETLQKAIAMDKANGLEPFLVCATLGTTSCVSFDNLAELGPVCRDEDIWLHVDAAYAGSALICPEFQYLMKGIELVTSFNMNPNKWMLINFDCSLMWVKDRFKLTRAFVVDPLYLQHSFSDQAIDYRHWGIPLSRRFRALKLWFVIRNYGISGLQDYIRNHVRLAKLFEQLIRQDSRFTINNQVVLGLVCFRLIGSNALNQRLLSMINASGKLHMVPASLEGRYVIRFCVCDQNAKEEDIRFAYECISQFATELFESIRAGKERIRAISQQNTIDVSSVSLHTQQSASADRLNRMVATANQQSISSGASLTGAGAGPSSSDSTQLQTQNLSTDHQHQQQQQQLTGMTMRPASPNREAARQYLMASRRNSHALNGDDGSGQYPPGGAKSPLQKQTSLQAGSESTTAAAGLIEAGLDQDDLEQEIVLDSLDDYLDLDEDEDDDVVHEDDEESTTTDLHQKQTPDDSDPSAGAGAGTITGGGDVGGGAGAGIAIRSGNAVDRSSSSNHSRRRLRSSHTTAASATGERDEAEDEVFNLAKERRNRMSLRYKREFFVRVVSDPRVYRASISGDINASCNSLGNQTQPQPLPPAAARAAAAAIATTSAPQSQPQSQLHPKH